MNASALRAMWAGVSGVHFPGSQTNQKAIEKSGLDPEEWISTQDAADLLEYSSASFRRLCGRRGIESKIVVVDGQKCAFWKRSDIRMLEAEKPGSDISLKGVDTVNRIPSGYVTSRDAMKKLSCSRSTLHRMEALGFIKTKKYKVLGGPMQILFRTRDMRYAMSKLEKHDKEDEEKNRARKALEKRARKALEKKLHLADKTAQDLDDLFAGLKQGDISAGDLVSCLKNLRAVTEKFISLYNREGDKLAKKHEQKKGKQ